MRDITLGERLGCILFLACGATAANIGFWFPWHAYTYHSSPDDRYGGAIMLGILLCIFGAGVSWLSAFRLFKWLFQHPLTTTHALMGVGGGFLTLAGLGPALSILLRICLR